MIFFLENSFQLGVFWPRRGLQDNHRTVRKSAIFPHQAIKNGLNEAILLMSINDALLSRQTLCLSSNQDFILYESDLNCQRGTSKNTPFQEPADA